MRTCCWSASWSACTVSDAEEPVSTSTCNGTPSTVTSAKIGSSRLSFTYTGRTVRTRASFFTTLTCFRFRFPVIRYTSTVSIFPVDLTKSAGCTKSFAALAPSSLVVANLTSVSSVKVCPSIRTRSWICAVLVPSRSWCLIASSSNCQKLHRVSKIRNSPTKAWVDPSGCCILTRNRWCSRETFTAVTNLLSKRRSAWSRSSVVLSVAVSDPGGFKTWKIRWLLPLSNVVELPFSLLVSRCLPWRRAKTSWTTAFIAPMAYTASRAVVGRV